MFDFLKWIPIHKRLLYNKATLRYKALNGLAIEYITNMLTSTSQVYDRTLGSSVDGTLAIIRSRTSLYDQSISVSAPKYWNSLPYTYIKNEIKKKNNLLNNLLMLPVENALNKFSLNFPKFYAQIIHLHHHCTRLG